MENEVTESLQDHSRTLEIAEDIVSRFEGVRPRTCFLFASHGHPVGGLANAIETKSDKVQSLDPNELFNLQPKRREDIL